MAHQIEEYDVTFSTTGTEWHGLAQVIAAEEMKEKIETNLFFPIVESPAIAVIEGETVPLVDEDGNGWKVILADCRELPACEGREKQPPSFVPLHTPKQGYNPLENGAFFDALGSALDKLGIPLKLSTAGTLGNLAYFYFSLEIEGLKLTGGRGEEILPYLSGVTSHNGAMLPSFKDSFTRPVCMNTVQRLLNEVSSLDVSGKHTENGLLSLFGMEQAIEAFFTGTAKLEKEIFPAMQSRGVSPFEMREITAGYFMLPALESGKRLADNVRLSTQAYNATEGIVSLARHGAGNGGETLYDLFNGATDYWSNGAGVGSEKVGIARKAYTSNFGGAAKHKSDFSAYLMGDAETLAKGREVGAKVLANHLAN